jgi:hypothetical protein
MLRKNLLLTTAFVVAAAMSSLPAPALAQPTSNALSRSSNDEFLQTYCHGHYISFYGYSSAGDSTLFFGWKLVAVSVTGHGETIDQIVVKDGRLYSSSSTTNSFVVGIFGNTSSGFPGSPLATGTGRARKHGCGKETIAIPEIKLRRGAKYWIEEGARFDFDRPGLDLWKLAPNPRLKTLVQSHKKREYHSSSSSTTPWTAVTGTPYFRLKHSGMK